MNIIPSHDFSNHLRVQRFTWGEKQNYNFQVPHRHKYLEVIFFQDGGGTHSIGSKDYLIQDRSIHIVNSGMIHQVKRSSTSSGFNISFRISMIIEDSLGLELINTGMQHPCSIIDEQKDFDVLTSLTSLIEESIEGREKKMAMYLLNAVILKLIKLVGAKTRSNASLLQLLKVVQRNRFNKPKPKDISGELNVSVEYLNRLCQQEFGYSSQTLIDKYLIEFIKQDIMYTNHSIKKIAYGYSFHDPSHFNRFFKKIEGITPGDFRKSLSF